MSNRANPFVANPFVAKSLTLRPKLILAFVMVAMMAAACGAVGLFFVNRIGASVAVFSEVTSPLLTESIALTENVRSMRSAYAGAITQDGHLRDLPRTLHELDARSREHIKTLRRLVAKAGISVQLDEAELRAMEFIEILNSMIAAHSREQLGNTAAIDQFSRFEVEQRRLSTILIALVDRFDSQITRIEDKTKVRIQTGEATADELGDVLSDLLTEVYPVVQMAGRMVRLNDGMGHLIRGLRTVTGGSVLATYDAEAKKSFGTLRSVLSKLSGRLRGTGDKTELTAILDGLGSLETLVLGPAGVIARQRELLNATAALAEHREELNRIERTYFAILDDVTRAVMGVNQHAKEDATQAIAASQRVIAGSALLTLLAALGLGLLLAHRITKPLLRLADHAVEVRASGELRTLTDPAVAGASDEIGTLARSFNLMIEELDSARKRLIEWSEGEVRTQYERLNAAIDNMPQGLCMFDSDRRLIICNSRYAEIYGLPAEYTMPGTPLETILRHRVDNNRLIDNQNFVDERLAAVAQRKAWYLVTELQDGHTIAVSHQPMPNGGSISTHEDITERRKAEARIAYMAHHDALTGLPNRVRFRDRMEAALQRDGDAAMTAVMCVDLDDFKNVNDTLGHPVGDALLKQVAERLCACVHPNDTVARLGGDEFAIVQTGCEQPMGATTLVEKLINAVGEPFDVLGHQVVIGASVGIAIAPHDGNDPDDLLKDADMALYRAKEDGRGTFRFFEAEMDARMQVRRTLELELRRALAVGEFEVFYQPLINLASNEIASFEALIRWRHPERGMVPPDEFIPLAEEIGLIGRIGSWVLKQACTEAMNWPPHIRIAVNLSAVQFKGRAVVLDVIAALAVSGLAADRLDLEITETVLLQDTDATIATLNELRALGVHISMDDFGTGYSSLGYLRRFPFDKIKIDRSFVRDLGEKADSMAIVRAVTGLGNSLSIPITAEGVETESQLNHLKREGCTEVQGFLFSKPKPASEIAALLREHGAAAKAVA